MVDYNSTYTGAQVDAAVQKDVDRGPRVLTIDMAVPAPSFDLTIPTGLGRFSIMWDNVSGDSAGDISIRFGVGGVIKTTGYDGYLHYTDASNNTLDFASTGGLYISGSSASSVSDGHFDVQKYVGTRVHYSGNVGRRGDKLFGTQAGSVDMAGDIDTIRFTISAGNIDSGRASVYLHM